MSSSSVGFRPPIRAPQRAPEIPQAVRRLPGAPLSATALDELDEQLMQWAHDGAKDAGRRAVYRAVSQPLMADAALRSVEVEDARDKDDLIKLLGQPMFDIAVTVKHAYPFAPPAYDEAIEHQQRLGADPAGGDFGQQLPPPQYDDGEPMPPRGAAPGAAHDPAVFPRAPAGGFAAIPALEEAPRQAPLGEALTECCRQLAELQPQTPNGLVAMAPIELALEIASRIQREVVLPNDQLVSYVRLVHSIPLECMPCEASGASAETVGQMIYIMVDMVSVLKGDFDFMRLRDKVLMAFHSFAEPPKPGQGLHAASRPPVPERQPVQVPPARPRNGSDVDSEDEADARVLPASRIDPGVAPLAADLTRVLDDISRGVIDGSSQKLKAIVTRICDSAPAAVQVDMFLRIHSVLSTPRQYQMEAQLADNFLKQHLLQAVRQVARGEISSDLRGRLLDLAGKLIRERVAYGPENLRN